MTYAEKLRDPRWQKKRLQILKRDEWMCQSCGETGIELQVDHKIYLKNHEPWEYKNNHLITLCKECHKSTTEIRNEIKFILFSKCDNIDCLGEMKEILQMISGDNPYHLMKIRELIKTYEY